MSPLLKYNFFSILVVVSIHVSAQDRYVLSGVILDGSGEPVPYARIAVDSLQLGSISDDQGNYTIDQVPAGMHTLSVTAMGYETTIIHFSTNSSSPFLEHIVLTESVVGLEEVVVEGQTVANEVKSAAYSVEVLETKKLQNREININQMATRTAGIRVRESGGLGSNFTYSLNGMSGRSVRFFVDGIPLDRYGSGYGINNFPVNLINRIEIYKGVVPPRFGSDALGGIVNIITQNSYQSYLDASYSLSSFNTHRAALSSRWIHPQGQFYVDLQSFYNYSDNNYFVWGPGVDVANPETGRTMPIKTRRFHDAYESVSGKIDLGVLNKPWTDQMKLSLVYADNSNEIQHGATMSAVYGEATRSSISYAPSLYYTKENIINDLDISLFSSVSWLENHTTDTSSRKYNWFGEIIDEHPTESELGSGRNGKSLLTLNTLNQFHQANLTYRFSDNHHLKVNYTYDGTIRDGHDPLISNRTASFKEPQQLTKMVSSLAYQGNALNNLLENTLWVKNYDFKASTVDEEYVTDSLGYRPVTFPIEASSNNFGFGYALKYNLSRKHIGKLSIERCFRIPDAEEILGDGLFVQTNPFLLPEESINLNIGWLFTDIQLDKKNKITFEPSFFYRNVYNLILYSVPPSATASGSFSNVQKVRGLGGSLVANYSYRDLIKINGNVTYQDMRDWNKFDGANRNPSYKDLLRNTPYLMANGGLSVRTTEIIKENDEFSFFWDLQYVHEFFRYWPSLGARNTKHNIPSQLVNSIGVSYSFKSGRYNISFDCNNIFNEQIYDNYLLQKPGRSFSTKLRVFLK